MQVTNSRKGVARAGWRWLLAVGLALAFQPAFAGGDHQKAASLEPEQIRMVQRSLQDQGYDVELTSQWDEGTRTALAEFQAKNDLPRTGRLDPATSRALGVDPHAARPVGGTTMADTERMTSADFDPAVNCAINTTADCRPGP